MSVIVTEVELLTLNTIEFNQSEKQALDSLCLCALTFKTYIVSLLSHGENSITYPTQIVLYK